MRRVHDKLIKLIKNAELVADPLMLESILPTLQVALLIYLRKKHYMFQEPTSEATGADGIR